MVLFWFSPNAIIRDILYTNTLCMMMTKAIILSLSAWYMKLINSFSNFEVLSQINLSISVGRVRLSLSWITAATTDCIYSCAWVQLKVREVLTWVGPRAFINLFIIFINWLSFSSVRSQWGKTSDRSRWLALRANEDDLF